jgi:hypothetical protein
VEKVEESEETWKMQQKAQRISKIHQNNPKHGMLCWDIWGGFILKAGVVLGLSP